MKTLLSLFVCVFLLSACTQNDSKKIDLYGELQERAKLSLTLEDSTEIAGFEGDYCTDIVCMEKDPIDFTALVHTSVAGEEKLLLHVDSPYEISSIGGSIFKTDGSEFYRNLSFIEVEKNIYTPSPALDIDETEFTLHVKVIFNEQGRTNFYFPLRWK